MFQDGAVAPFCSQRRARGCATLALPALSARLLGCLRGSTVVSHGSVTDSSRAVGIRARSGQCPGGHASFGVSFGISGDQG
jgi:hypothetical protein